MKHFAILAALLLVGCAHFQAHTGEFQPYLCATLEEHGATLPHSIPLYAGLPSRWQTNQDKDGIIISTPRINFTAIDAMLRGIFGEPQIWCDKNLSGGQHGVYGWKNTGCVIQYLEDDNQTTIIVLKKPKGAEQIAAPLPSEGAPSDGR